MKAAAARFYACSILLAIVACSPVSTGETALPSIAQSARTPSNRVAAATSTVPYFQSSFSYGGTTYPYKIVGTNPMGTARTTTVAVAIVPLRLIFSDGSAFDATAAASHLPQSPLFTKGSYPAGETQYGDALMRSEFWAYLRNGAAPYHVLLAAPKLEPTISVTVPRADGYTSRTSGSLQGRVTYAWFVQTEEKQLIGQLHIPPTTLAIFPTVDVDVLEPGNYCCYLGYHSAISSGSAIWTTAWASISSTNISVLSHEVAEWLNDPFYTNRVPPWVSPESNACGGDDLEVGDPVTLFHFKVNGYEVQDEAFFSWFARVAPSKGIHEWYDLQGNLQSPAADCS
ncbi:MAG: hypothetical protein JO199_09670 [Candidatus Eremiobacteraeota bacterium]|nr:hypothetical protein [Candidatus Eremiobacteraeota bacterium]